VPPDRGSLGRARLVPARAGAMGRVTGNDTEMPWDGDVIAMGS
jgi:hypothetical protein